MNKLVTLLIVEDEVPIRKFLRAGLSEAQYRIIEAVTGTEGIRSIATQNPDLVLLDLGLPDIDGLECIRRIREWSAVPIIVISARGQEEDKIQALDPGANDYLTKPFLVGELLARIRVALRPLVHVQNVVDGGEFRSGSLHIDFAARRVTLHDEEIHLTPLEYKLLSMFVRNAGKVLTHRQLLTEVWGSAYASQTHYLRVFMKQLRQKLEEEPAMPRRFLTEAGVGYRFVDSPPDGPGLK